MAENNSYTYQTNPYGSLQTYRKIYKEQELYPAKSYTTLSRYQNVKRLFDSVNDVYYQVTPNLTSIPETKGDTYVTVDKSSEGRLDVIANMIYGYSPYWWIIAIANNIVDPFNVTIGTVLRCPPLASLYGLDSIFP